VLTLRRNLDPFDPGQLRTLASFRRVNAQEAERWIVSRRGKDVYDVWVFEGIGNVFDAGTTSLALAAVRRDAWCARISDPSPQLDREVAALQRAWDLRRQ